MNADPVAGALVTAAFAVTGAYYLCRLIAGFSWVDRVNNLTHVLMSLAMIAMPWPFASAIPTAAQIIVFTVAALWYVYLLRFRPGGDVEQLLGHHDGSVRLHSYHAFVMISMVWMAVAISPPIPGKTAMSGMSMGFAGMPTTGSAGWTLPLSAILGVLFALAAGWFVVLLFRRAVRGVGHRLALVALLDTVGSVVMAAGMAVAFLVLMT